MSKQPTPLFQYNKTRSLLTEIRLLSGMSWKNLYAALDESLPGLVSCQSNLRQFGNGIRFLSDTKLYKLAKWALIKGWGGDHARAAHAYIPPTVEEIEETERAKRHERYLIGDPTERILYGSMKMVAQEKRRCVAALDMALAKLSPTGFSHADILYMVHSWLIKNPPTEQRGKRQRKIVLFRDESLGSGFSHPILPESLPTNFVLPEHCDGRMYFISCSIDSPERKRESDFPDEAE